MIKSAHGGRKEEMLKIVVFDSGYGGEFFADRLSEELPIVDVIRVIDWRNAEPLTKKDKEARKIIEDDLEPYLGKVDLIVFANYYLSATSLDYFKRKYRKQQFIGLDFKEPDTFVKRDVLVLATNPVIKTLRYQMFLLKLKRKNITLALDSWPAKIDDGELTGNEIKETLMRELSGYKSIPQEVILANAQFSDIKKELKKTLGRYIKIYDGFDSTIREINKTLKIRGGLRKLKM